MSERDPFAGPWFDSRTAMLYIPCKSIRAVYAWCWRHHVVRRNNGSIAKRDIDRVLNATRRPRRMNPRSLANLRLRHATSVAEQSRAVTRESFEGPVSC